MGGVVLCPIPVDGGIGRDTFLLPIPVDGRRNGTDIFGNSRTKFLKSIFSPVITVRSLKKLI